MEASSWRSFEKRWTDQVVSSINLLRNAAGLTIKQMTARLNEVGWPVSEATVNGILSGHKRSSISVVELFAFARALGASPSYLMLGLPSGATTEGPAIWGDGVHPSAALEWIADGVALGREPEELRMVEAFTRQGLDDLRAFARSMRIIEWQSAILAVLPEFPRDEIAQVIPGPVLSGAALAQAFHTLAEARSNQARLRGEKGADDKFGIDMGDLAAPLSFVDGLKPGESVQLSQDQIESLASPQSKDEARAYIRKALASASGLS